MPIENGLKPFTNQVEISLVSPVYNSQECIEALVAHCSKALRTISDQYEIILVDDGSSDSSWEQILKCVKEDPKIRGVRLSRNFGQHAAITAGFKNTRGNFTALIDCDLQDSPEFLPAMYQQAKAGANIVLTIRNDRKHPLWKKWLSNLYCHFFNWTVGGKGFRLSPYVGSFSMLSRLAVKAFLESKDNHSFYLNVIYWLGFRPVYIEVNHHERFAGKSGYSIFRMIHHAIDGLVSQSDRLLWFSIKTGLIFFVFSVLFCAYVWIGYFLHGFLIGWASIIVAILFSTGLILMSLGVIGIYLGKCFEEVKGRPLFIVEERVGSDEN